MGPSICVQWHQIQLQASVQQYVPLPQGLMLGSALFNIFVNDTGHGNSPLSVSLQMVRISEECWKLRWFPSGNSVNWRMQQRVIPWALTRRKALQKPSSAPGEQASPHAVGWLARRHLGKARPGAQGRHQADLEPAMHSHSKKRNIPGCPRKTISIRTREVLFPLCSVLMRNLRSAGTPIAEGHWIKQS